MEPHRENLTKQIFVAYAHTLHDQRDYRKSYTALERSFDVKFVFAEEEISDMHVLQKIISFIRGSARIAQCRGCATSAQAIGPKTDS